MYFPEPGRNQPRTVAETLLRIRLGLRLGTITGLSWGILANLWLLDWWTLNAEDLVGHSLPWTMLAIAVCHLAYDVTLSCLLVRICSPHWSKGFVVGALLLGTPGLMFPPSALVPWLSLYGGIQGVTIAYGAKRRVGRPAEDFWARSEKLTAMGDSGHCSHCDSCPLYPLIADDGVTGLWKTLYCHDSSGYKDCARYKLSSIGEPVPLNLLPSGTYLEVKAT